MLPSSGRPREGIPLLAAPASRRDADAGGHAGFLQMVRISSAVAQHKAAGLPYIVYLRHPTTGGVMASWGSLGHMTVGRAGRAGRVPRRRGSTRRSTAGRSPRACRPPRTSTPAASSTPSCPPRRSPGILDRALTSCSPPGTGSPPVPAPPDDAEPRPGSSLGPVIGRGGRTGPAYAGCSSTPPATSSRSTAPGRASTTPGCCSRWSGSGTPCVFLGQDRRRRPPSNRWGRGRCEWPGAGYTSPLTWTCPW